MIALALHVLTAINGMKAIMASQPESNTVLGILVREEEGNGKMATKQVSDT
jgi:hypothetical protein